MSIFTREPAMTMAAIGAILALIVGFGVPVTVEQSALIYATLAAILGLIVRQQVTPVATLAGDGRG